MRYNPRVDLVFKKIFGSAENQALLLSFTNAVLAGAPVLKELTVLNPYQPGDYIGDRLSILDIKARDEQGQYYNIEMQVVDQSFYTKRALYYWSKVYAAQIKQAQDYGMLTKTISIHLLNFNHLKEEPDYHNVFHILNAKSKNRGFEDFEIHFIELQKFKESPENTQVVSALDRWATFLSGRTVYDREHIPTELKSDPSIVQAIEVLETMHLNEGEKNTYEAREKWFLDKSAAVHKATRKALAKGEQIGREKGREEGEQSAAQKIAHNLLAAQQSPEMVAEVTGLPMETVRQLHHRTKR